MSKISFWEWGKWRASIYMCKWMSRQDIRITKVRAQRVQDISAIDAVAEGCPDRLCATTIQADYLAIRGYELLWGVTIGHRKGCKWKDDPLVWAYTFEQC